MPAAEQAQLKGSSAAHEEVQRLTSIRCARTVAQAVAYCSNATDPVLEVNEFQLLFNADQKSISFNINARSTREIRATLSLNLNA